MLSSKYDVLLVILVGVVAYWFGQQNSNVGPATEGTRADASTGIEFALQEKFHVSRHLSLAAVGTRKLAILNVYSLGFYVSNPIQKAIEKEPTKTSCDIIQDHKAPKAVKLTFSMNVGPEKIAEAVSQLSNVQESVRSEFHDMVLNGMGDGKMKQHESMSFEWKGLDTVVVTVRGKFVGEMKDKALAAGVLELYLGSKSVSPSLRKDLGCTK